MNEENIKSYMKQFNASREVATEELDEILKDYYRIQEEAMQEVYRDIIKSSY